MAASELSLRSSLCAAVLKCPLLAQSGLELPQCTRLLRTQSGHGVKAAFCLGLSFVVNRSGRAMQRHGEIRKPGRRSRTSKPKARKPIAGVPADALKQIERLRRERDEALEQLAATSEVLRVISHSPGELEPVFRAALEQATRVCAAKFGIVFRYEGGLFHPVAWPDVPAVFEDFIRKEGTFAPKPGQLFGRPLSVKSGD